LILSYYLFFVYNLHLLFWFRHIIGRLDLHLILLVYGDSRGCSGLGAPLILHDRLRLHLWVFIEVVSGSHVHRGGNVPAADVILVHCFVIFIRRYGIHYRVKHWVHHGADLAIFAWQFLQISKTNCGEFLFFSVIESQHVALWSASWQVTKAVYTRQWIKIEWINFCVTVLIRSIWRRVKLGSRRWIRDKNVGVLLLRILWIFFWYHIGPADFNFGFRLLRWWQFYRFNYPVVIIVSINTTIWHILKIILLIHYLLRLFKQKIIILILLIFSCI
jgi:hypothetical protein